MQGLQPEALQISDLSFPSVIPLSLFVSVSCSITSLPPCGDSQPRVGVLTRIVLFLGTPRTFLSSWQRSNYPRGGYGGDTQGTNRGSCQITETSSKQEQPPSVDQVPMKPCLEPSLETTIIPPRQRPESPSKRSSGRHRFVPPMIIYISSWRRCMHALLGSFSSSM